MNRSRLIPYRNSTGKSTIAVVSVEEFAECLDAADDEQQIVLAAEREHGIDEVVTRTLVAELNFQAVGEKNEKIARELLGAELADALLLQRHRALHIRERE